MENTLNAIKEMPLTAAYYMGKRDAYKKELEDQMAKVKATPDQIGRIKAYYLLMDACDERFAIEMGWPDSDRFFK